MEYAHSRAILALLTKNIYKKDVIKEELNILIKTAKFINEAIIRIEVLEL